MKEKVVVLEDIFKLSSYSESISSRSFSVVPRESFQNHRSLSPKLLQLNIPHKESVRYAQSTPINTIIMFVPQQEAWVVERMGRFNRILQPGLNFLVPIVDKVKYVQSLKELAIDIPKQSAITLDNVTLNIDGVLYLRVVDPYKASYGVEDPEFAITQLAQTTMRSELGKISLDSVFRERESLNFAIVEAINKASNAWGIDCLRYEIRDIRLPQRVNEAMQMQVEAERKKRAAILESEGIREADINVAEGKKRARILSSEAEKTEQINRAQVMSFLGKRKKADLIKLAIELGECESNGEELKIIELRTKILTNDAYKEDPEFVKCIFEGIVSNRIDEENKQKEQTLREFELQKIRLQNETQRFVGPQTLPQTKIELKKLLPTFNPEVDNMDLFLTLFEQQMKLLDLGEDLWVPYISLVPYLVM
ncbi:stomatin-like protein 2, mitochondrial [Trichonephila clavipes]|nr:stomatin-like protein 2, mitochondrial [Trichonephila clavipes]